MPNPGSIVAGRGRVCCAATHRDAVDRRDDIPSMLWILWKTPRRVLQPPPAPPQVATARRESRAPFREAERLAEPDLPQRAEKT
jgi:hypothetical protein